MNKKTAYAAFGFGLLLINIVILVPYACYQDIDGDFLYYSVAGNTTFVGFSSLLLGLGFCFMLLPVLFGMIPAALAFLSWKFWLPISKASFSIYLIHLAVMRGFIAIEQYGFSFSQLNLFTDFVFSAIVAIPIGIFLYMTVEAPFARILKLVLMPPQRKEKDQPLLSQELQSKD